ncbi:MAG: DUF5333 family protein [Pseudomonadota bacterium]
MKFSFAALASALVLAGCNTGQVPSRPVAEVAAARAAQDARRAEGIERVYAFAVPFAYARQIARNCRRYDLNRQRQFAAEQDVRALLREAGLNERLVFSTLETPEFKRRVQDDGIAWIQKRGIVLSDRETFCAAGDAEVAERSEIASYLR